MNNLKDPNIVVIGGGTGTSTLLRGLKHKTENLSAIVSVADSGGSSGVLRDQFGILPPGDLLQATLALGNNEDLDKGFRVRDENHHTAGNRFLAKYWRKHGKSHKSIMGGISLLGTVMGVAEGHKVIPASLNDITLTARDGDQIHHGEDKIGKIKFDDARKVDFSVERNGGGLFRQVIAHSMAVKAIKAADVIVIAPGGLYYSLAPVLSIKGIQKALKKTNAKIIYVSNLMNNPGHTDGYAVQDCADEVERFADGKIIDTVIYNNQPPSQEAIKTYAHKGETPVKLDDRTAHYEIVGADLLGEFNFKADPNDLIAEQRTAIRHDPPKTAQVVLNVAAGDYDSYDLIVRNGVGNAG